MNAPPKSGRLHPDHHVRTDRTRRFERESAGKETSLLLSHQVKELLDLLDSGEVPAEVAMCYGLPAKLVEKMAKERRMECRTRQR